MRTHILLIGTCVWLDLAKDTSSKLLIIAFKCLTDAEVIKIILLSIDKELKAQQE